MQRAESCSVDHELPPEEHVAPAENRPFQPTPAGDGDVEETIACLRQRLEAVRRHEIKRMRGRLGMLNGAQEKAIESLTQDIMNRILHAPVTALLAASGENECAALVEMVHRLFDLGVRHLPCQVCASRTGGSTSGY